MLRLLRLVAVVVAVLALAGPPSPVIDQVRSTLPDCTSAGPMLRYVVLFDTETPEQQAAHEVRAACGTNTAYYPQIGVGVVTSGDPTFVTRFGPSRAYSAHAEASTSPQPAALASPVVPLTAAQLPGAAQALGLDRSAEQWDMEMIRAGQARAINRGHPEVLVGVLDSGIDATHPDLVAAVDPTRSAGCLSGRPDQAFTAWSPTLSRHGTHVAGTIAAADDERGINGVAPGVRLASVKVVDDAGFIYPEYAVCGFMWAARQQMRIVNSSYSLDPWLLTCSDVPGQAVAHEAVRRAVAYATARGVLSIAAVGNDDMDLANPRRDLHSPNNTPAPQPRPVDENCGVLPAQLPGVVAVSAVGAQRVKSGYSSYGRGVVAVTAPGGDWAQPSGVGASGCVLSTVPGGYGYACGTSMAAPHVSGVAALLASAWPDTGPEQLASLLGQQAGPLPCPSHAPDSHALDSRADGRPGDSEATCADDGFYGQGLVDALAAVTTRPGSAIDPPADRTDR